MTKGKRITNVLKKIMKRKPRRRLAGIKQGVGAVTTSAFPKSKPQRSNGGKLSTLCKYALNAMHPAHLALPRAVGSYSVIRTTDVITTDRQAMLFGAFMGGGNEYTGQMWHSHIAVGSEDIARSIGDAVPNAYFFGSPAIAADALNGARMVPAAITVQIMNGDALQTTAGIAYVGRSKTVLNLMGDSRTWEEVMKELVSYSAPRLCSAGKLALRGVQTNAVPNNMQQLSDFAPRRAPPPGLYAWTEATYGTDFEGFGQAFVYNPSSIFLSYLVTIEWRVRFDPLNPAYAGHTMHEPASESTWNKVIGSAESMGNGVVDIADVTADIGAAAFVAAPFLV